MTGTLDRLCPFEMAGQHAAHVSSCCLSSLFDHKFFQPAPLVLYWCLCSRQHFRLKRARRDGHQQLNLFLCLSIYVKVYLLRKWSIRPASMSLLQRTGSMNNNRIHKEWPAVLLSDEEDTKGRKKWTIKRHMSRSRCIWPTVAKTQKGNGCYVYLNLLGIFSHFKVETSWFLTVGNLPLNPNRSSCACP